MGRKRKRRTPLRITVKRRASDLRAIGYAHHAIGDAARSAVGFLRGPDGGIEIVVTGAEPRETGP